jgi:hypothetical protein
MIMKGTKECESVKGTWGHKYDDEIKEGANCDCKLNSVEMKHIQILCSTVFLGLRGLVNKVNEASEVNARVIR